MRRFRTPNGKLFSDGEEYLGEFSDLIMSDSVDPKDIPDILTQWIEACPRKFKEDFTCEAGIIAFFVALHDVISDDCPADEEPKLISDLRDCLKELGLFYREALEEVKRLKGGNRRS